MSRETIAAVATAPGKAGVAVVRISGGEAFAVAACLLPRLPAPGHFARMRVHAANDASQALDDALVLAFRGPYSYTGEDVVEIQCHGGRITPQRILEACFAAGARLARRGEFTERAFLNGRLDYEQAASVLALIDAKTARAADDALAGLSGRKRQACRELYERTLALSTEIEHALDVDEDELPSDFTARMRMSADAIRETLTDLIRRAREGRILREGALVVLTGAPNVGKSSLMNALLEENRAIVSDTPGTTRDAIEAWLDLEGWPIRLVDTAGLRTTSDAIEAEGVRRAEELAASADVVLRLVESHAAANAAAPTSRELVVGTKADMQTPPPRQDICFVSARTGAGLAALKAALVARVAAHETTDDTPNLEPLLAARAALSVEWCDLVLAGNAVRTAAEHLGRLVGATYSADLLDRLFSRFCVGK